jgi:hypothetical protein
MKEVRARSPHQVIRDSPSNSVALTFHPNRGMEDSDGRGSLRRSGLVRERKESVMEQRQSNVGAGWVLFAAIMMIVGGFFAVFGGLGARLRSGQFYAAVPNYPYGASVSTWGWVQLIGGVIVLAAGLSLMSGAVWARIVGITIASLSMVANFFFIPFYPFWALTIGVRVGRHHDVQPIRRLAPVAVDAAGTLARGVEGVRSPKRCCTPAFVNERLRVELALAPVQLGRLAPARTPRSTRRASSGVANPGLPANTDCRRAKRRRADRRRRTVPRATCLPDGSELQSPARAGGRHPRRGTGGTSCGHLSQVEAWQG